MEQLIPATTSRHMKDKKVIGSTQHGFTKGKSCLTNLMTFYDEMTDLVHKGRGMNIVYLDFSKAFDIVLRKILTEKLTKNGLDEETENWLNSWAQRVMISCAKSSWSPVMSNVPQGSIQGPVMFNISINDLGDGAECILSKFADDRKSGAVADTPEGCRIVAWFGLKGP